MTAVAVGIAAGGGLVVGSFVNVIVHRVPRGLSLLSPPSSCPACGAAIRPRDNVPVVSFLLLRGRCRSCRARISPRYPATEAATGALFAAAAARFPRPAEAALVAGACAVLLAVSLIDLEHRRVPNVIVLPSTAAALAWAGALALAWQRPGRLVASVACAAGSFALLYAIAAFSGGMGMGDVKLAAFIGAVAGWFGWEVAVLALFAGFIAGGVVGVALLATGRRGRKDAIPFAPMLSAGAALALFAGPGPVRAWLG